MGTTLKIAYRYFNERTQDYKILQLTEKENWQGSFAGVIHDISERLAEACTLDLENQQIRDIRAKSIAFEGLKTKGTLLVHLVGHLDPFKISTHEINISGELKKQATEEARAFIEERKRVQGDLFAIGDAVVRVNEDFKKNADALKNKQQEEAEAA